MSSILFFIGTQAAEAGKGIVAAHLDTATGELTFASVAAEVERPTWLLADPNRPVLYAVSEVGNAGDREGAVLSFAIADEAGSLKQISRAPSGGGGATHLALESGGAALFVANFGGGQVASLPVAEDGALAAPCSIQTTYGSGPHRRQTGPHAHGVTIDPSGNFVLVPDMGADRLFLYRWDGATLSPADQPFVQLPPGCGPRLILFGIGGELAYLLTELSAEIFVFAWDPETGLPEQIGRVALDDPAMEAPHSAAAITLSDDGRFLYVSNRATHTIQVYAVDAATGLLAVRQCIGAGGEKPWAAEIAPGGEWLVVANQGSDSVRALRIDRSTGTLSPVEGGLEVATPSSIAFRQR